MVLLYYSRYTDVQIHAENQSQSLGSSKMISSGERLSLSLALA